MRRTVLLKSVQRLVGESVVVVDAAYAWSRHRWVAPYAAVAFGAVIVLAPIAGVDDWPTRFVIGLAAVGVAVLATTRYVVLAQVDDNIVLFDASRIRQVATKLKKRLGTRVNLDQVGGTVIAADWQVGDRRYTVARSSQTAMERMSAWSSSPT